MTSLLQGVVSDKKQLAILAEQYQRHPDTITGYSKMPCTQQGSALYCPADPLSTNVTQVKIPNLTLLHDPTILYTLLSLGLSPNLELTLTWSLKDYRSWYRRVREGKSTIITLASSPTDLSLLHYFSLVRNEGCVYHLLRFGAEVEVSVLAQWLEEGLLDYVMMAFKAKYTLNDKYLYSLLARLPGQIKAQHVYALRQLLLTMPEKDMPEKLPINLPLWMRKLFGRDALPTLTLRHQGKEYSFDFTYHEGRGFFLALRIWFGELKGEWSITYQGEPLPFSPLSLFDMEEEHGDISVTTRSENEGQAYHATYSFLPYKQYIVRLVTIEGVLYTVQFEEQETLRGILLCQKVFLPTEADLVRRPLSKILF